MDSLSAWVFEDAEMCWTADQRHTFFRVEGRPANPDVSRAWGVMGGVAGEGSTPEAALADAMRKATQAMETAAEMRFRASVAVMGGRLW